MRSDGIGWGVGSSDASLDGPAPGSGTGDAGSGDLPPGRRGIGFRSSFAEDLPLLARGGITEVRLPLEWARIEPSDGHVDDVEVEHLRRVLTAARDAGLAVWGCLVDGTLPGWFAHDERGFSDDRSRSYFWARQVERVGELFGDLVDGWVPFHEPNRWAHRGWITGSAPPRRVSDGRGFAVALEGALLAMVDAARRLRGGGQPVCSSVWVVPLFPARPDPETPADAATEAATTSLDRVLWGSFHRLMTEDVVAVGDRSPVDVSAAREVFDEIGFTYRGAAAVRADGALLPYPQTLPVETDGRVPWAHGFGLALHHVADSFPERPVRVTGVGTLARDDSRHEEFVREVVEIVRDASDGGMDLRGVWWESPFDSPGMPGRGLWDADRSPRPSLGVWTAT
ncbi:MAG: family 1 glycosylhydrolase [Acidimicrobiales bacterium]|nr:family 1 glycosylhydrolase [Acidimicrobiales bacterium]